MNATMRSSLAQRVAADLPDGAYVNLGIGLPTLVADFLLPEVEVLFHSENGLLGVGPKPAPGTEDPQLINAGKEFVTLLPGAAVFDHTTSFMMVGGGHIDIAILGAYQVGATGDLANWITDDRSRAPAVGGAMDLAVGAKQIWVMMEHCTKDGQPRLLEHCTLPLTARKVVTRVYTEFAVIDIAEGFIVRELRDGISIDWLQEITGATLRHAQRKG